MTRMLNWASIFVKVILIKMAAGGHLLVRNRHSGVRMHIALVR